MKEEIKISDFLTKTAQNVKGQGGLDKNVQSVF